MANWLSVAAAIDVLITAVSLIGSGFKIATGDQAETLFEFASNPLVGLMIGVAATALTQSSSTTTALAVPLAGSGAFTMRQIYPFTLGTNIGTTITALVAAFAFDGVEATAALTAALVHLFFNLFAVLVIFCLPVVRDLPPRGATWLANLAAERKIWAGVWAVGVFVVLPLILIFATSAF